MDKFLEIIYQNQIVDEEDGEKWYEFFLPLIMALEDTVSDRVFQELQELLIDAIAENNKYYCVKGMKLAIGIANGTYIPKV